jgi:hypothetical protein
MLAQEGHWVTAYLDDFIGIAASREEAWAAVRALRRILATLGLVEATPKFVEPARDFVALGVRFDFTSGVIAVTPERAASLSQRLQSVLCGRVSRKEVESITGRLLFVAPNLGDVFFISPTGGAGCPVQLFSRFWKATSHLPSSEPLFRHVDGRLVSRATITAALRRHGQLVGVPVEYLSTHSLRIGSATALASAGLSLADIMMAGRWASTDSALKYLRLTLPRAERFMDAMSLEGYFDQSSGLPRFGTPWSAPRSRALRHP